MNRLEQAAPWDRDGSTARRRSATRRRAVGVVFSLVAHVLVLTALMFSPRVPPQTPEPTPITVSLVDGQALAPAPIPAPEPAKAPQPSHERAKPTPVKTATRRPEPVRPLTRHVATAPAVDPAAARAARIAAEDAPIATSMPTLSASQLAGAASAEGGAIGGGGGTCDMAGRLQEVLRHDRLVRTAVSSLTGKSIMVWNGEWKWMPGDTGQGLTAVRQALIWEIAYAPEACRSKPMHGLVLFSVNEAGGPVRLAVGQGDWRWTDLLAPRGAARTYRP